MNHVRSLSIAALAAAVVLLAACSKEAAKAPSATAATTKPAAAVAGLESDEQRVSYGIGYNFGMNIAKQTDFNLDQKALKTGFDDGLSKANTRISEADIKAAIAVVQQKIMAANAAAGEKNLAAAASFLAKNKARAGVITTASGLQYEVLAHGKGPKAKASDTVEVDYKGTLMDGTEFDSSVAHGGPATFKVGGVIKGWVEALQLMSVGDKFKLYIPTDLGYGPQANGKIPANSLLIFEVQLNAIK
jgi:FKBP-type peptidyl-prolyl cis-trans isomerase